jgi:lipoprotein-anchoring transpeptidase ErfK/SrfK
MRNTTVVSKLRPKTILIVAVLLVAGGIWVAPRFATGEGEAADTLDAGRGISREPWNAAALPIPVPSPHIVVRKAQRKLLLYSGEKLVRAYRIGLGLSPVGNKVQQGDRRTPEGDFYIFTKNDKSAFYLSLGISYPNATHAGRGLRDNLITRTQYDTIIQALNAHKTPPQNTKLGGDIYIHGNGAGSDWTWGCVALENDDIRELFNAVTVGTPVTIKP